MKNLTGKLLSDRWKVFPERMVTLKHKSGNLGAEYTLFISSIEEVAKILFGYGMKN